MTTAAINLTEMSGKSQSGKKGWITYLAKVRPIIAFVVGLQHNQTNTFISGSIQNGLEKIHEHSESYKIAFSFLALNKTNMPFIDINFGCKKRWLIALLYCWVD